MLFKIDILLSGKKIFLLILSFGIFTILVENVYAYPGLNEKPLGLEGLFKVPSGADSYVKNYETTSSEQVVIITEQKTNQVGSIFSTDQNKLDLSKDFSAKMKIYLGNRYTNAGDGMTFTMHNDSNAINNFNGATGEYLGAYYNQVISNNTTSTLKKSFVVEFDPYFNSSGMDAGIAKTSTTDVMDHIAYTFPDQKGSYSSYGPRNSINHQGLFILKNAFLSNGSWHDFKISWNSKTSEFTYQFDNYNPTKAIIYVDSVFGTESVYWGFTGSTGARIMENAVAFTKIPGLVEISDELTINNSASENIADTEVNDGEILTSNIAVKYNSGNQNLTNSGVNVTLGNNIDFREGTVKLNGKFVDVKPDSNRKFTVPLDELSLQNPDAILTFETQASTSSTTAVDSSVSYQIAGENLIGDTKIVNFKVKKIVDTTPPNGVVKTNLSVPVNGVLELKDMFSSVSDDSGTSNLTYSYVGTALDMTSSGKQTVTVRITDPSGNYTDYSVPVEVTPGNFGLLYSDALNFGTIKSGVTMKNIVLSANQTVGISMEDQRGTKAGWRIQAKTSDFTPKSTTTGKNFTAGIKLPKGTVQTNGTTSTDLTTLEVTLNGSLQNVIIAPTGKGTNGWTYTLGTASNPVSLVNIPTTVYVGDYQATLTWSMINAPN